MSADRLVQGSDRVTRQWSHETHAHAVPVLADLVGYVETTRQWYRQERRACGRGDCGWRGWSPAIKIAGPGAEQIDQPIAACPRCGNPGPEEDQDG